MRRVAVDIPTDFVATCLTCGARVTRVEADRIGELPSFNGKRHMEGAWQRLPCGCTDTDEQGNTVHIRRIGSAS